jgi:16S rRNA (cytidine1402-2'-O)-methyltransferase
MKRPAGASKNPLSGDSKTLAQPGKQGPNEQGKVKQEHYGELTPKELEKGLYLIATPIGHARDISLRAMDILKAVDLIAAEDTRVTSKLLAIHGISRPLASYNDYNAARERPRLLEKLKAGACIALVSDAGTPLVSDPGFKLVRAAQAEDIAVHAVPGASAVLTGLSLSGLPSDRFLFAGFLPAKSGERRAALEGLKVLRATLIFFESAQRLGETLAEMDAILGQREAVVAREMTKLHEEVRRGPLAALASHYAESGPPRGEVTLLVGPPGEAEADFGKINVALDAALVFMPVKAASELIAELTGVSRKEIYALGLKKKNAQA